MELSDLQVMVNLFRSHLSTIDLVISIFAVIMSVFVAVLTIAGFSIWGKIKNTIKNKAFETIEDLANKEREKLKKLITKEVRRIAKEEGNELFQDLHIKTASTNKKQEMQ